MLTDNKTSTREIANSVIFSGIFTIMYFASFSKESLWIDELYSWYFSTNELSFWELFSTRMTTDVHPPVYYSMLHIWGKVFGHSKEALRLFSFVPAILSFLFLYAIKLDWFDTRFKHLIICLIASSFLLFNFSMDARSYEWIFFFSLVSSLLFLEEINSIINNKKSNLPKIIFLFIFIYILSLIHFVSFIYAGLLIITLLLVSILHSKWPISIMALVLGLFCLGTMLLWMLLSSQALGDNIGGAHWIKFSVAPYQVISFLGKLFSANVILGIVFAVALIKKSSPLFAQVSFRYSAYLTVSFFIVIFLISIHSPIVYDRYLIAVSPPLLFMMAFSIKSLSEDDFYKGFKYLFRYTLVFSIIFMLALHTLRQKAEWEGTADIVRAFPECIDQEILTAPSMGNWLQSYYFTSGKPKFVEFSVENYTRAINNICPILSWSVHLKLYRNDLAGFMRKNDISNRRHNCISQNLAEVCFK